VVIEQNSEVLHTLQKRFQALGGELLAIRGDATEDEILEAAGIQRAKGILTAMGDDKLNLNEEGLNKSFSEDDDLLAKQQRYHFAPKMDVPIHRGDILVVIGTQDKLDKVRGEP